MRRVPPGENEHDDTDPGQGGKLDEREKKAVERESAADIIDVRQEQRNENHQAISDGLDKRVTDLTTAEAALQIRIDRINAATASTVA